MSRMTLFGAIVSMVATTLLTCVILIWAMWDDPWHYWPVYMILVLGCAYGIIKNREEKAERRRWQAEHEQRLKEIYKPFEEALRRFEGYRRSSQR